MNLTPELVADILLRQGLITRDQGETIRQEAKLVPHRLRSSAAYEQKALAYDLVMRLHLPNAKDSGAPIGEQEVAQAIAADAGLLHQRIDSLSLNADLMESKMSRPFARRHRMIPLQMTAGRLRVACANPYDLEGVDSFRRLAGREIELVVASEPDILKAITEFYGLRHSVKRAERDLSSGIDLGNLEQLVRMKSETEIESSDQRIKTMSRLDIAEKRRPQDGRIKATRAGRDVELRVATLPVAFGEKVVMRIFDPQVLLQDLTGLGFYPDEMQQFNDFISRPHGIVLVTGPTGSGKTTTLYSTLKTIASREINVTTIEDPIEMVYEEFNQTSVQLKVGITFAGALRHILRQDPDVIMVGEIRDPETAQYSIQAALTGHLVFSTLHTNDASTSISRLVDLGVERFLIGSTVVGAMAQRLLRRICPHCIAERHLTADEVATLRLSVPAGKRVKVKEGNGCFECRGTGYFGRTGIFEILPIDEAVKALVMRGADAPEIKREAVKNGMRTLRQSAMRKLAEGVTTFEEVVRVTGI